MDDKNRNPLFGPQADKAGSWTFDKYDYQYHWALYEVLTKHKEQKEYAVFVEYHEDVIIADSLNEKDVQFEFNQIKTTNGAYTPHKLTTRKKINKKKDKSVLGKLISNLIRKDIGNRISNANLVALNGFNLELKDSSIAIKEISITDLSEKHYKHIENAINEELNIPSLPANIQFIIPTLNEHNYDEQVIGLISKLINTLFPTSQYNSENIYRILIDELHKKGKATYDFSKWNDLLKEKALTSTTVSTTISNFTSIKDETMIEICFNDICNELQIKAMHKVVLRRSFMRYKQLRISNNSSNQIEIKAEIINLINTMEHSISSKDISFDKLLIFVKDNMSFHIKNLFYDEDEINAAIICEFIMKN